MKWKKWTKNVINNNKNINLRLSRKSYEDWCRLSIRENLNKIPSSTKQKKSGHNARRSFVAANSKNGLFRDFRDFSISL